MWKLLAGLCLIASGSSALADTGNDIFGNWARGDGKAKVKIVACGGKICAINTWIKPGTPDEKAGDKLVMDVAPEKSGKLAGTAFDPQRDLSYRINITYSGNAMTTQGCILGGLLCKGIDWKRLN